MDRTRHSQEQLAKPGDQIILREQRFTLNTPLLAHPHLPTFSFFPLPVAPSLNPPPSHVKQNDPQTISA